MRFSTNMKQILTLSLAIIPLLSWAYDTEVDGFAYNLNEKTKEAEVTYGWNNYVGDVVIPSSMTFEGITYSVTSIVSSPEITWPFHIEASNSSALSFSMKLPEDYLFCNETTEL